MSARTKRRPARRRPRDRPRRSRQTPSRDAAGEPLPLAWLAAVFGVWRLALQGLYWAAPTVMPYGGRHRYSAGLPSWLAHWFHWDSGWLFSVVNGYSLTPVYGRQTNVAFFPLYPLTVKLLGSVPGISYAWAGLIISHVFAFLFLVFFYRITARSYGGATGRRAVLFFLLYPASFFLVAFYSESLLLFLMAASLWYALERRWFPACALAGLASSAKVFGLVLLPVLAILFLRSSPRPRRDAVAFALVPAGLVGYMEFLWYQFSEPLAWVHAQSGWKHTFGIQSIQNFVGRYSRTLNWNNLDSRTFTDIVDIVVFLLVIVGAIALVREGKTAFGVMSALIVLATASVGRLVSVNRYALAAFPVFGWFAARAENNRMAKIGYSVVSGSLLVVYAARFFAGKWAG